MVTDKIKEELKQSLSNIIATPEWEKCMDILNDIEMTTKERPEFTTLYDTYCESCPTCDDKALCYLMGIMCDN